MVQIERSQFREWRKAAPFDNRLRQAKFLQVDQLSKACERIVVERDFRLYRQAENETFKGREGARTLSTCPAILSRAWSATCDPIRTTPSDWIDLPVF